MAKNSRRRPAAQPAALNGARTVATNRRARFQYHLLEEYDAGMALLGTEIKSIRMGRVNLRDGFVTVRDGEAWLHNVHIAAYAFGNRQNHEETRPRRLLLHKREISRLHGATTAKGLTIVPVRLYLSEAGLAKVVIALAQGKKLHDKRAAIADRDAQRAMDRARKRDLVDQ